MNCRKRIVATMAGALALAGASLASARESNECLPVSRNNVVRCAVAASYGLSAAESAKEAAEGRRAAVGTVLPSNPVVSVMGGRRWQNGEDGSHWGASLAQELEIAGQRGLRQDAAQGDVDAQSWLVAATRREVAADAWKAYFETIAAAEEKQLARRLLSTAERVAAVARAKAESGLLAPVEADVAESASVRVLQRKIAADRRAASAGENLAALIGAEGGDGVLTVEGDLVPLDVGAAPTPVDQRPEMRALDARRLAEQARADAFRRARIPNPTASLTWESDRFEGTVLTLGLAFPIPIGGNVGRTYAGEIAEAEALARQRNAERERLRREIRAQLAGARIAYESYFEEVRAFTPERLSRSEQDLRALADEVESGRLAVRDAVVAQQALIEVLEANVEARKAWCLASVELAFVAGMPLERGAP